MKRMLFRERLASFADRPDECWEWPGAVNEKGYGRARIVVGGRVYRSPHQAAYAILVGPIPDGTEHDHLCRNRRCMNPGHLDPVSHRENVLRGETLAAANARKVECKRGHAFTPENTHITRRADGREVRSCRECDRLRAAARYATEERREYQRNHHRANREHRIATMRERRRKAVA